MRILFLNPPRFNELVGKNPSVIEHNRGYNPPLGALALATAVRKFAPEHAVTVLDCQPGQMTYEELKSYFEKNRFDLVGITAMTFTLIDVRKTASLIKKVQPECKVALGGPHVHIYPNETIALGEVDYLIQGEGELAALDLIEAIAGKRSLCEVRGIVYIDNGKIVNKGIAPKIADLDSIPYPDRTFLPIKHYGSLLARGNISTTMFTSRGCPFKCTFCDRPMSPTISGFRWRSAKSVVDEIAECAELGISEILIYDDTFTVRKERVHEICEEILSRGLKVTWDVRAHVNTVDVKLVSHMKEAGCDRIHFGVESGNDRMLKVIRKNTSVKRVKQAFAITRRAGIEALAYFMIGQQTETLRDINDTMSLARELDPDYCHFTIFCPYPATEIYQEGLSRGIFTEDLWRDFARNPKEGFEIPVWEENFSKAQLHDLIVKCYKSFYARPGYILRRLCRVRSLGELRRKVKAGLAVLGMKPAEVDKLDLRKAATMK